ncbi:MAG: RimK family alpha-L-glutamate ligase [Lachnospiraceae bacterium]|nr:RimK family alpha-L-glutamate ligase [Lachnospiraceae bacterium]
MKQGWLIVNEYLDTEKFLEIRKLFLSGAEKKNVKLTVYTNADFAVDLSGAVVKSRAFDEGEPEFIIFYDKDITLADVLQKMGYRLYNSADAIDVCDSKVKTATRISEYNLNCRGDEAKILMPKTYKVPFTYENIGIKDSYSFDFLDYVEKDLCEAGEGTLSDAYPMVIKESNSSFGMGVHLATSREEAVKLICEYGNKECIIQEYLSYSSGRDYRLQMVSDKCVCAMMRSNENDFRANITNGGKMSEYKPTDEDLSLARNVMKCLKLDFAGIDIMHDKSGRAVFLEANSNAHFKNIYDLTGINAAEKMIEYIVGKAE